MAHNSTSIAARFIGAARKLIGVAGGAVRRVFNRIEGATSFSTSRGYIYQGYQSSRFDATKSNRMELVRKARYFEYNSALVNKLADIFENYTVGAGTPVIPASSDADWNQRAAESWSKFCKYPCVNSLMSFGSVQSLIARRWFIDGEVFILLTNGSSGAPRLQLIETHLVNTPPEYGSKEGTNIFDGVLTDPALGGRPIGYFIGSEDANGKLTYNGATSSDFVIHVFEPMRANEFRGLPFTTPVINLIQDLDELHIYEMKAAKDAAETSLFIETQSGELDVKSFRAARYTTTALTKDSSTTVERTQYYKDMTGGRAVVLKQGDKVSQANIQRPGVNTLNYWRLVAEEICSGVGIPYCLAFPESMQGTVYRGTLAMAATFFNSRFTTLASTWERIYEYYMKWAVRNDPTLRGAPADFYRCTIQPPASPDVDRLYNSTAVIAELEAGTTNYDLIYGPRGKDWRVELRKKAEQAAYIKSLAEEFKLEPKDISAFRLTAETQKEETNVT